MLNLLIIDKDVNHSMKLLNEFSKNSEIKVYNVTDTLLDGIKLLNTGIIDITIINIDCTIDEITNSFKLISKSYIEKYKKSMIVLCSSLNELDSNDFVYSFLKDTENISKIYMKTCEIVENRFYKINRFDLIAKINKELEYIGYNMSYTGTKYLSESIALIYSNHDYSENLNKNIYPIIAKKYNKTVNNIKCSITCATTSMFYDCDETRLKNYFNFYTIIKPKPKVVIYTILNKIYNY